MIEITPSFNNLQLLNFIMGNSKKDLNRRRMNLKTRLDELEQKARMDPLKRNRELHEEIAMIKKKMTEE